MLKKRLLLSLTIVMLIACFAQAKTLEIWYVGWTNEFKAVAQNIIDADFVAKTGVDVNIQVLSWSDYYNRYLLALASRDTPDIFVLGTETVDFGIRGGLMDLAKFKPEEFKEKEAQIFGSLMGPFSFKGTRFGVPVSIGAITAAYRADILTDLGMSVPKTWDDIKQWQPKALAQGHVFGLYYGSVQYDSMWGAYTLITQNGGQFFNPDGFSSALDKPESIKGFQEYISLFKDHNFPLAGAGLTPFTTGEWLMLTDGLWLYPNLLQHAPELRGKWVMDLVPGTIQEDGSIHHGSYVSSSVMGISPYAKNPEEAWEFIKWFSSEEIQTKVSNAILQQVPGSMWLPANKNALQKVEIGEDAKASIFGQLTHSEPVPYAINVNVLYRYVTFAIDKSVLQNVDPKEAVLEAAKEMNEEMARRQREYSRLLATLGN